MNFSKQSNECFDSLLMQSVTVNAEKSLDISQKKLDIIPKKVGHFPKICKTLFKICIII